MHRREEYEEEMPRKKGGEVSMDSKRSIASFAGGLIFISLALIIGPFFLKVGWTIQLVLGVFGILGLIIGAILVTIAKLYVKTAADVAFYRTGQGKPKVIIDGGAIVVPVIHEIIQVSLQTMKLEVDRSGQLALICKDYLRADVTAEFYIRVQKDKDGVTAAATTLGRDAMTASTIKDRLMEKLVSALRTVAATMDLNELHQERDKFAAAVQEAVTKDIKPNGLVLETVTISRLDMTDPKNLREDNVFDSQGLKKAASIVQEQKIQRNKIEREAELQITQKDVETRKSVLAQQQDQAFAEADQKAKVANQQALKEKDIQQFKIEQDQAVQTRQVESEKAVQTAQFQKDAELVKQAQAVATAEVTKTQAVDVANREKDVAIADAEAKRAEAQANQRIAEAKAREAQEKVTTAATLEIARRNKDQAVIAAEQEGQQNLIKQQKIADAAAYTKTREAEADKTAAENQAQAQIRLADAGLVAKQKEAEGDRAVKIVPVQVASEQVEVDRKSVEVLTEKLKAQDTYQEAAIKLEIFKAKISAGQVVGVEMAKAFAQFMSKGDFNIFGDPKTLAEMTALFTKGLGISQLLEGMNDGSPELAKLAGTGIAAATAGLEAIKTKAEEVAGKGGKGKGKETPPPEA
ncbi:MAG: SPFH domain-containing protein [Patescibacteria group bacterium]